MARRNQSGFTFAELLVVMTVMVILLAMAGPAIRGLGGGAGRRGAVNMVVSAVEQARVTAALEGASTYLVVADMDGVDPAPSGADKASMYEQYHYKAFAIFREDSNPTNPPVQVSPWRSLPPGIAIRKSSQLEPRGTRFFAFPAAGTTGRVSAPYLKLNTLGEIEQPDFVGPASIRIFQGISSATAEVATSAKAEEVISVSRFTGRATYQVSAPPPP